MQGLVLTGHQIGELSRLVDSDEDEVTLTFQRGTDGQGLYACSTVRAGSRPLFRPEPELPAGAIQPASQPRR